MSLVYRSVFNDSDGRIATALRPEFERWLDSKALRLPKSGLSQRGSALESDDGAIAWATELDTQLPNGDRIYRVRLIEETADARWITTAAAIRPAGDATSVELSPARIWVDLEHEPVRRANPVRPGSPRLVRELLAAGEGYDGPVPLTAEDWTLQQSHVAEIASYISSPHRSVPVIVFAHDGQDAYDQPHLTRRLARDVAGVAAVFRLADASATEQLANSLPEGYAVYGGAMRTYLPGAISDPADVASRHRILGRTSLVALGSRAFPAVKDQILELSTRRPAPVALRSAQSVAAPSERVRRSVSATAAAGIGRTWLNERLDRMRRALRNHRGNDLAPASTLSLDDLEAFDVVLDELVSSLATQAPAVHDLVPVAEVELRRQLVRETEEREALEQLLNEAQENIEDRALLVSQLTTAYDDLTIEATEAREEVDSLDRRVRWLERRVRDLGDPGVGTDEELPTAPSSVAEVVALARQHLSAIHVGEIEEDAAELDLHGGAQLYAIKSWAALCALDAYAQARSAGMFHNSFYAWCQEPPPGQPAISATAVAMVESESVESSSDLRNARTFAVPTQVAVTGRKYMPAHVKVVRRGAPAPRLHFYDDAAGTGKVYVGYLGAHLPTARF
ncbi:hypothetical protein [Kribbella sp. VKM Ac-2568]|uniref:hypothetical protein n=1 Tax=Kribbella sp. VKM Ac-2568 TaxID=2512219 RepID=UPI001051CCDD|nr:hypothetical protein [Kribbella sp. VKM Ac-2568]TCM45228.1 hypothetical protein EV648_107381 [Kribbella sp. VKM Ac-2568]